MLCKPPCKPHKQCQVGKSTYHAFVVRKDLPELSFYRLKQLINIRHTCPVLLHSIFLSLRLGKIPSQIAKDENGSERDTSCVTTLIDGRFLENPRFLLGRLNPRRFHPFGRRTIQVPISGHLLIRRGCMSSNMDLDVACKF